MGQRVRRLSSPGREEKGEGEGQEERGGETGEGERREERRRQAQLLQIHRELQNVEVILHVPLLLCLFNCISVFICAFFLSLSYLLHLPLCLFVSRNAFIKKY